ncbi:alpha/beta hydrolase fold domain-containing protein [uncultured Tateyamaria sp.]|uniref:alpha/beta hydrolase n=1 Tax=uncultured Tateyamaria sp. TaxID=455651 RepID=UPI002611007D|nr:alpha/beta hydrolase fold domain-containing protein [uncultured Tateyamaria sp.]
MSWQARLLNIWLRATEKPFLTRAKTARALRVSFDLKARLFFHAPFGTRKKTQTLADRPALFVTPRGVTPRRVILHFHGGAHVFGSPQAYSAMLANLARRAEAVAILPQYPLAPEHSFPQAPDHCLATYRAVLAMGYDPADVIIGGDSAGGNLALSVLVALLRTGEPLPAGLYGLSPLTDMTFSGRSVVDNADAEVVLPITRISEAAAGYLDGHPGQDPLASPLFADFSGACPVWLTAGDTEILLDDTVRLDRRLRDQGVRTETKIERDLPHVWPLFHNILPEARVTLDALAAWCRAQTGAKAATR